MERKADEIGKAIKIFCDRVEDEKIQVVGVDVTSKNSICSCCITYTCMNCKATMQIQYFDRFPANAKAPDTCLNCGMGFKNKIDI